MISPPAVDGRRVESFFQELRRFAPHYTPDLNMTDEQSAGVALMRIFAQLAEIVAIRMDQAPQKHFVAFLDKLGITLLPARPARAAVTFRLASGLEEVVRVPSGTRVTAPGPDDEIPFETTNELVAIPGALKAMYGVDPLKDQIFSPPPGFLKQEPRTPTELSYEIQSFVAKGSNRLQLNHTTELEPGSFLRIGCKQKNVVEKVEEGNFVTLFQPLEEDFPEDTIVLPIRNFEVFNGIDRQEHILFIGHNNLFTIKEEVEITLEITLKESQSELQPLDLVWQFWTEDETLTPPGLWKQLKVRSDGTASLSSSGRIVLVKPADFEIKPLTVGGRESRWIRAELNEALPVGPRELPEIETIQVSVNTVTTGPQAGIFADQGFYNATPLDVQVDPGIGFFPFGTEPRQFDQFYVASEEAFSKKEAEVVLDFDLDLQTLAGPSLVAISTTTGPSLRAYSIGLRRRLYELDLKTGFNLLSNPAESLGSSFLPIEDSIPAAITDSSDGVFVFVNTVDTLTAQDPANKIWVHDHRGNQLGTWKDLDAPGTAQTKVRLRFSPAAVRTPSGWPHFSRVFVVGADGKLYSRGVPENSNWDDLGTPGVSLDSSPFAVVAGAKIFVFVNGAGTVHWLTLTIKADGSLDTPQWKSLKPKAGSFKATYRPFAQSFVDGDPHAKVFTFAFIDPNDKTTGRLFECDTRSENSGEFEWVNLDRPTNQKITEDSPDAHALCGYIEDPIKNIASEGKHIFLRGADNELYERLDDPVLLSVAWERRSRPADPSLRDSPAIFVGPAVTAAPGAKTTTIHVVSATGRNSLVRWDFEIIAGSIQAINGGRGVPFGNLASSTDDAYNDEDLKLTFTGGSTETRGIDAYDGALKLARLDTPLSTLPDDTTQCEIVGGDNLGLAENGADKLFVVHAPNTEIVEPIYVRINLTFVNVDFHSRRTGLVSNASVNNPVSIYSLIEGSPTEFQSPEDTGSVPELSWEFFNGRGWLSLRNVSDDTHNLLRSGKVTFEVPKSIESTEVAGQENFWVRARLVGGDYGRETFKIEGNPPSQTVVSVKSTLRPPKVRQLLISYKAKPSFPELCLTFNNLDFLDQTAACEAEDSHFPPFETLEDRSFTIFFGFDKTFKTGPVRMLIDAAERSFDESNPPEFEWSFRKDRKWKKLDAEDGSIALTRQGILTVSASDELTRETRFGEPLFWIKGSLRVDRALADADIEVDETEAAFSCEETKAEDQEKAASVIAAAAAEYPFPLLLGVFLNTTWAIQGETIIEEIVGSGDGEQNQTHAMQRGDVLEDEDIRVQEALSAEERERIERELGKDSVTDREDLGGTWVRWKSVKALFDSAPQDRCYEIDRAAGLLRFGDGVHGSVVPAGVDNIRAFRYRTGGGAIGNVKTNEIQSLGTAVAGIESVFNPAPAGGGSDKADTEEMLTIGPRRLSHRDRAVSVEDFEELAYEASREVAKARCLGTTNLIRTGTGLPDPCDSRQLHQPIEERGWVSMIIVPDSTDPRPCPSLQLRRVVKDFLRERAPSVVAAGERIVVRPPDYVIVNVHAKIFVTTLEKAAAVETEARTKLEKFLHPVSGGPEGKGWEFGRPVTRSDVFALLERIADVDRVEDLMFLFRDKKDPDRVTIGPNEILASGDHRLAIKKA